MKGIFCVGTFALGAFVLVPHAALAQNGDTPRSGEELVIDVDRAETMFQEAFRLSADNQNWNEAAGRYVESARLRPYGDLQAYMALNRAGQIFSHLGKEVTARRAFAAAGIRALETGLIYEAAVAYANAAELAQQDRRDNNRRASNYPVIAHRLSEAPVLSDEQRKKVQGRLGLDRS